MREQTADRSCILIRRHDFSGPASYAGERSFILRDLLPSTGLAYAFWCAAWIHPHGGYEREQLFEEHGDFARPDPLLTVKAKSPVDASFADMDGLLALQWLCTDRIKRASLLEQVQSLCQLNSSQYRKPLGKPDFIFMCML